MIKTRDLTAGLNARKLLELQQLLSGLVGQKCWKVAFSYGGELCLHLGKKIAYESPKLRKRKKGTWIIGTCGTNWILFTPNGRVRSHQRDEQELAKKTKTLEGKFVTGVLVNPTANELLIRFGDGYFLVVSPDATDKVDDVPYWEVFMPGHRLIESGPGNRWSLIRSDVHVERGAT